MLQLARRLRNKNNRRGQGMTEYIIIVGLIAILLITAVQTFKGKLQTTYEKAAGKIDTDITQKMN